MCRICIDPLMLFNLQQCQTMLRLFKHDTWWTPKKTGQGRVALMPLRVVLSSNAQVVIICKALRVFNQELMPSWALLKDLDVYLCRQFFAEASCLPLHITDAYICVRRCGDDGWVEDSSTFVLRGLPMDRSIGRVREEHCVTAPPVTTHDSQFSPHTHTHIVNQRFHDAHLHWQNFAWQDWILARCPLIAMNQRVAWRSIRDSGEEKRDDSSCISQYLQLFFSSDYPPAFPPPLSFFFPITNASCAVKYSSA